MPLVRARGIVCVVSDRRRLRPAADDATQLRAIVEQAWCASAAGVDLFQVRERDLSDRRLYALVIEVLAAVAGSATRVIVNDRLDIALAAGAHGVQLPSSGLPVVAVRANVPGEFLIGRSIHGSEQPGPGIDFAIFGTVFPSASKPSGHASAGVEALAAASRRSGAPVLAIGGITADTVREVAAAASGVAAIGWLATTDSRRLAEAVAQVRAAFDTITPVI